MKKINLLLVGCLMATCVSAQYGQKTTPHPNSILTSAKVTSTGEFLVGGYYPTPTSGANFTIDRLDANGDIPSTAPYFSKDYKVVELPGGPCGNNTPPVNDFIGMNVIETSFGGASYAMAGSYSRGVIFCLLDNNGSNMGLITYNMRWPITMGSSSYGVRPYLAASAVSGVYYISGSSNQQTFVLKIDLNNPANNWSWLYNEPGRYDNVRDIIESPYNSEVIVVGVCNDLVSPAADEAFFMRLDQTTGNVIRQTLYGTPNGDEWFTSIEVAQSTASGGNGFIIGGRVSGGAVPWMLKVDPVGNPLWNTVITPSYPMSVFEISDVMERYDGNNPGNFQYYGSAICDYSGVNNIVVWKLDDYGNPVVPECQFLYPMTGNPSIFTQLEATQIDLTGNGVVTPGDGFEVWATDYTAGGYYFSKAYFNGYNGCNSNVYQNKITAGPGISNSSLPNWQQIQSGCQFQLNNSGPSTFFGTCWNSSVAGGSNARTAQATGIASIPSQQKASDVYPNPSSDKVTVSYTAADNSLVKIEVMSSLGQLIKTIRATQQNAGTYSEEIDFDSMQLNAGVYFVNITVGNTTSSHKVMYMNNK